MINNLRDWTLTPSHPYTLQLAADARMSRTNYIDDQVWQYNPGTGDAAAISLQTKYGGRAGLVSLVPMWIRGTQTIYQAQTYHQQPVITKFAPGYIELTAMPIENIEMQAQYLALESQAIGGIYTLKNTGDAPVQLRLDIFGHVVAGDQEQKLSIINLAQGGNALLLAGMKTIAPVVMMENGHIQESGRVSPRIGVNFNLEPGQDMSVRWVHAGLRTMRDSMVMAQRWLEENWQPYFENIDRIATSIPAIQTGNLEWDAVIASSLNRLMQSFLNAAGTLPYSISVAARNPENGYSRRGDGTDYPRTWQGLDPTLMLLVAPVVATIDAKLAQNIIRNYLALQKADGWIPGRPAPGGEHTDMLCMPVLAHIAWQIHRYHEDADFIAEVFPKLLSFFNRWHADDVDKDQDGIPEWQSDRQTGFLAFPTFATGQTWAQGAAIHTVETPDMLTYLLSEVQALQGMATLLNEKGAIVELQQQFEHKQALLAEFWQNDRYSYRDRDTHQTTEGELLLADAAGDTEHFPSHDPSTPSRLIVRVMGGVRHTPNITLHLEGADADGNAIVERIESKQVRWQNRQGIVTTENVFSQLDRVQCNGLSRVYRFEVRTLDTTALDINALLPLWSGAIPAENIDALVKLITDKKQFWRQNGVTMVSAKDPHFDPANALGGGALWLYWSALIGEALLKTDHYKKTGDMLKNLLKMLVTVMKDTHEFTQFYHSDDAEGIGEGNHLAGIVPVHLLMQSFGIVIPSAGKVMTGGAFAWDRSVTVRQHGVYVRRTRKKITVRFPSGYEVKLDGDAAWQTIIDPEPVSIAPIIPPETPEIPESLNSANTKPTKRVIIEVEYDE
ncbi:MAG: MGH1-like glycoside hydrolase domain-containing protein [Aggregatilineales bacterium]